LEDFEGDAFNDRKARTLMQCIHASPYADTAGEPLGAEIRITFKDGRIITNRIGAALGRGPDNPLPAKALQAKFANCAARALPAAAVEHLQDLLLHLDQVERLRTIVAAIAVPVEPQLRRA